jgi:hypothetical protein
MRRRIGALLALASATLACMTAAPKPSAPRLPTAFVVTVGQVVPPTSTIAAIKPTPVASPMPSTAGNREAEYRLRVEISTSSDWTNLEILNPEVVRDASIAAAHGAFTNHTAAPELIAMNQALANAEAGKTITLQVELRIDAAANADALDMILQKGDIGVATLKFYGESEAGDALIQEVTHDFPPGGPTGLNELAFSIPLR